MNAQTRMPRPAASVGPWHVDPVAKHPWQVRAPYADGLPGTALIVEVAYRPNAFLIAASPKLRDALHLAVRVMAGEITDRKEIASVQAQANAALAEAEGLGK